MKHKCGKRSEKPDLEYMLLFRCTVTALASRVPPLIWDDGNDPGIDDLATKIIEAQSRAVGNRGDEYQPTWDDCRVLMIAYLREFLAALESDVPA